MFSLEKKITSFGSEGSKNIGWYECLQKIKIQISWKRCLLGSQALGFVSTNMFIFLNKSGNIIREEL